ncbi:MAG: hypothetical protein QOC97_1193, partial [Chloroflexota bacterium]|nr:hypothetical protein [Chloroflexota bacterium]
MTSGGASGRVGPERRAGIGLALGRVGLSLAVAF